MSQPLREHPSLPARRAFVVQLRAEAEPEQGCFSGRVEHVLSGQAAKFSSVEELLAFFAKAAEVIAAPWMLAASFDFLYPPTRGEHPPDLEESARYFAAVDALTSDDVEVQRLVTEVLHLAKPLSALHEEPLRSRVVAQLRKQAL